jgi:uncharacterized protein (DUF3820 family)
MAEFRKPTDGFSGTRVASDASLDAELLELANAKMPFGKYAGMYLIDLPENYVLWFKNKGYPEGKLGERLRAIEEIKTNGLEFLLQPLRGK